MRPVGGQQEPGARLPSQPDVLVDMPCAVRIRVYPACGTQARHVGGRCEHTHATDSHTHTTWALPVHSKHSLIHTHTCAQALRRQELSLEPTENVADVLTFNHLTNTQLHIIVVLLEAF